MRTESGVPAERGNSGARGFNVYGFLSARLGLGEAARNSVAVLESRHDAFMIADVMPAVSVVHEALDPTWAIAESVADLPFGINVFHLNPPEVVELAARDGFSGLSGGTALNSIVPFWELPSLPAQWERTLGQMDLILAPSQYIKDTIAGSGVSTPLVHFPQAVHPPAEVLVDRAAWGIRGDATAFVCMFDVLSDAERKNPWGAIDAFLAAFEGRSDAQLLIKVNNARSPQADPTLYDRLQRLLEDERIIVIDRSLSRDELWSLYASVDAYVSLHRAEGLGLGLLEAMAVATPVIATAYSGNMDFMASSNSFPIPFTLTPATGASIRSYAEAAIGQMWAEPDLAGAVEAMRALAADRSLAQRIGAAARAAALDAQAEQLRGRAFETLLGMWETGAVRTRGHKRRVTQLRRDVRPVQFRRKVVQALRAAGLKSPAPAHEVSYDRALRIMDARTRGSLAADSSASETAG